jgi:hypothetical protein
MLAVINPALATASAIAINAATNTSHFPGPLDLVRRYPWPIVVITTLLSILIALSLVQQGDQAHHAVASTHSATVEVLRRAVGPMVALLIVFVIVAIAATVITGGISIISSLSSSTGVDTTGAGASTANIQRPAAPTSPADPVFTPGALGTSLYSPDHRYAATIKSAHLSGYSLVLAFDATGPGGLDQPTGACIQLGGPTGEIDVVPVANELTVAMDGHYAGTLTFPAVVAGQYEFQYACDSGYTTVPLGTITLTTGGVSNYGGDRRYFAVVLAARDQPGGLVVNFAAVGPPGLRSPDSSCLESNDQQSTLPVIHLTTTGSTIDSYFLGTMTFPGRTSGQLVYSCQSDYSQVPVP